MSHLLENHQIQHCYRVISIARDEHENYIATIQLVGKGQIFKIRPEEILADDEMTKLFSQHDVRMLTYLGYLSINSPKYTILAQRLSEKDNKVQFAIKKNGASNVAIKTAQEISSDAHMIKNLTQTDAHVVGYTFATEEILREKNQIEEYRKATQFQLKVKGN